MNKRFLLTGWLGVLSFCALTVRAASAPDWFLSLPAGDPALLVGRGMAERGASSAAEALAQAKREAMRDLAMSLVCRLSAQIEDVQSDAAGVESRFTSRTRVDAMLDLVNVKVLEQATTREAAFVLVAADRAEMAAVYRQRVSLALAAATAAFARAGKLEPDDPVSALKAYEETLATLHDAEAALQVYLALNAQRNDIPRERVPSADAVRLRLQRLATSTPRSLSRIADTLAALLVESSNSRFGRLPAEIPAKAGTTNTFSPEFAAFVVPPSGGSAQHENGLIESGPLACRDWFVLPVEFGTTGFVSEFGHALTAALGASLAQQPGVRLADDPAAAAVRVRGRMLREGEGILLVLQAGDRVVRHFVEPISCAAFGRDRLAPPDLDRLLADKLALHKALAEGTGLRVELRTDRLEDGPVIYRFGDKPRLAVRANQPCTLRLIYTMADGEKLLLLDKYPVGGHQVNRWVPLPLELEACAPPGVEQLLVQAVTDAGDSRLPALQVENRDMGGGYVMPVIVEPLDKALARTRGMMVKKPTLFAESVNQWTVFE